MGILGIIALLFSSFTQADSLAIRCRPETKSDRVVYSQEFFWGMDLAQIIKKAEDLYVTPKRLKNRAYYQEQQKSFFMNVWTSEGVKAVKLPSNFISSVQKHIEVSLERHYADAVIFPDMGHSHFFIPQVLRTKLDKMDYIKDKNIFYEVLFADPTLKVLYHTAEQLRVKQGGEKMTEGHWPQDDYIMWRYFNRNVIGANDGTDNVITVFAHENKTYNTLRDLPGYEYFGAGFNLSGNKDGCFEYSKDGKKHYFDMSMDDLPSKEEEF